MSGFRKGYLKLAVASLKASKTRSFLTMLGIVIGVVSVTLVVCIGQGVKDQISAQVAHSGPDIITIRPGNGSTSTSSNLLGGNGLAGTSSSLLSDADLQTVRTTPGVSFAIPLSVASGSVSGDHTIASPLIIATGSDLPTAINDSVPQGGFFDNSTNNHTVVLGQDIAHRLFDDAVPLGQTLTYRGQQFIVTGLFGGFSTAPFSISSNFNDAVFMPYSTAQTLNGGDLAMYQILAKTDKPGQAKAVAGAINQRLVSAHGGAQQATVLTADKATNNSDSIIHLLTLLIAGVATIALIVGGVGIMNIMLVSVTERMHEIGLRKAIGATNKQILRQFVAEAFVLSATGAIMGVAVSGVAIGLLRLYSTLQPVVVWQIMVAAPVVAVLVGIFFGAIPALKAARKDPIEALRHE